MTYKEAWRLWRLEEAHKRLMKRCMSRIDKFEAEMKEARRKAKFAEYAITLQVDKAFVRTVARYHGSREYGWIQACRCDGRLKRIVNEIGWDDLYKIIQAVRRSHRM